MQKLTTQAFETAFQSLNPEQKEAVNHIDGPVLVFAGPGTGKTKVLTVRIGNILQQTDLGAGSVLCLTFTNAGVQSMKNNLAALLRSESEKIEVHTYHSFASKLISSDLTVPITPGHSVLNKAQKFMILERLLSDPAIASSYLTQKPKSAIFLTSLAEIFEDFKKQDIQDYQLNALISLEVEKIMNDPDSFNANGKLKKDKKEIIETLQTFGELGPIYNAYLKEVERKSKYEFEDLLDKAICIFNENPELLATLQETYQYILVDEFQDTNRKQLQMLELLVSGIEKPNLFIVGDDDQCIYKFQGASNDNLDRLFQIIPDIRTISLRTNYRSTPEIINLSQALISKNADRPKEKIGHLVATLNPSNLSPDVHSFNSENDEAYYIASKINEAITNGEDPKSIAVLFRKRSYSKNLISWLDYFDVPYSWNLSKGDVLKEHWGMMFFLAIRYFQFAQMRAKEADNFLLNLCMLKFGKEKMAILYTQYRLEKLKNDSFLSWLEKKDAEPKILAWIKEAVLIKMDDPLSGAQLANLERWLGLDILRADVNNSAIITAWDAFVNEFIETNQFGTWGTFARLLNYYQHYALSIEFEKSKPATGIILSTIHGSKGLEYKHVFVMGCSSNQWENAKHPNNKVRIPKPMFKYLNKSADEIEDLRRLIYVAFTRAKQKLTLSYIENTKRQLSMIIEDIIPNLEENTYLHPAMDLDSLLMDTKKLEMSAALEHAWNQSLEMFELTATALNAYITNPEKFIWHSFFKIPDLPGEAMSFGSVIHLTLENLIKNNKSNPITEDLINEKWNELIQSASYLFDPLHFRQYKSYGINCLLNYFKKFYKSDINIDYITEAYLHGTIGTVKISGKIDLIVMINDNITVIDYKTGNQSNLIKPFESFTSPGDSYWRQGAIYAELIKQNYQDKELSKVFFHFVEKTLPVEANLTGSNTEWNAYIQHLHNHIANRRLLKYIESNYYS